MRRPLLLEDKAALAGWREHMDAEGLQVGFVPTMGKLHEGHLALMRLALSDPDCDRLLVSIYVNPTQFRPGEDFAGYPRQLEADLDLLAELGVAACFAPSDETIYPAGDSTRVSVEWGRGKLCDVSRPGHFDGVVAVVARLFNLIRPRLAVFGQKDAQQALILRRLVRDLHFPLRLRLGPTVRESDGLAMSSRNAYLDHGRREQATALFRALEDCRRALQAGERDPSILAETGRAALAEEPGLELEYFAVVDPDTLEPPERVPESGKLLVACAARLGDARLIDNHVFSIGEDGIHETLLF